MGREKQASGDVQDGSESPILASQSSHWAKEMDANQEIAGMAAVLGSPASFQGSESAL